MDNQIETNQTKEVVGINTRKCHFCKEEIAIDATRCKHCSASLYRKKPWLAAVLNIIIPGVGYIYVGRRELFGWFLFAGSIASMLWSFANYDILGQTYDMFFWLSSILLIIALGMDAYNTAKEELF